MKLRTSHTVAATLSKHSSNKLFAAFAIITVSTVVAALAFVTMTRAADAQLNVVTSADILPIDQVGDGADAWYADIYGDASVDATNTQAYNAQGSAEFHVADDYSYASLGLHNHQLPSLRLADLSSLSYATYQEYNNSNAVALRIAFDRDVLDEDTSYDGELVFQPSQNTDINGAPVTDGVWQTWATNAPDARWWTTNPESPCPESRPCTLTLLQRYFPNAGFNIGAGNALVLQATGEGFTGFADVPTIGVVDAVEFWDFEANSAPVPTYPVLKEECKDGGWELYGDLFKNQGACVSYIVSSKS